VAIVCYDKGEKEDCQNKAVCGEGQKRSQPKAGSSEEGGLRRYFLLHFRPHSILAAS